MEARNLRNMSIAQPPLLGDENTPLHVGPGGGVGFGGATPQHQVAFTPNPLATPSRISDLTGTPRVGVLSTPLRTPMRDNLSINTDEFSTGPRKDIRTNSAKRALHAGFSNLPTAENNFVLVVPEDDDEPKDDTGHVIAEEDAAERDARERRLREAEERAALMRRSQAVRMGLPRPAHVDVEQLLQRLSIGEDTDTELSRAHELINLELVQLLSHDAITHPLPGTSLPGQTVTTYNMPLDEDVAAAKSAIHTELASTVGFPNASPEQLREGLLALSKSGSVNVGSSWAAVRQGLRYDKSSQSWVDPEALSFSQQVEGYSALLDESRDTMAKDASKAAKIEKKLGVTLAGYLARSAALSKRITEAFAELHQTNIEYNSFSRLRVNESAVGPRRVAALKEEVERLEKREGLLQGRYAELDAERKESLSRIAALEEKIIADAEGYNDAQLAQMEAEG